MRNSNTLKVLIFTRDISNNPEKLTIYARITVNGKRAEISLKRYVSVNEWDENRGSTHFNKVIEGEGCTFTKKSSTLWETLILSFPLVLLTKWISISDPRIIKYGFFPSNKALNVVLVSTKALNG